MSVIDKVISTAAAEDHYSETPTNRTKFGKAYGQDGVYWCCLFVWWVIWKATAVDMRKYVSNYASCATVMEMFRQHGALHATGQVGDQVFYHFQGEHPGANHTGILARISGGAQWVWEGNTNEAGSRSGGMVLLKSRTSAIIGYGRFSDLPGFPVDAGASPATPQPAATPKWYTRPLSYDKNKPVMQGNDVGVVQGKIGAVADKKFGPDTAKAVIAWQKKAGFTGEQVDGVVGRNSAIKMGA